MIAVEAHPDCRQNTLIEEHCEWQNTIEYWPYHSRWWSWCRGASCRSRRWLGWSLWPGRSTCRSVPGWGSCSRPTWTWSPPCGGSCTRVRLYVRSGQADGREGNRELTGYTQIQCSLSWNPSKSKVCFIWFPQLRQLFLSSIMNIVFERIWSLRNNISITIYLLGSRSKLIFLTWRWKIIL